MKKKWLGKKLKFVQICNYFRFNLKKVRTFKSIPTWKTCKQTKYQVEKNVNYEIVSFKTNASWQV